MHLTGNSNPSTFIHYVFTPRSTGKLEWNPNFHALNYVSDNNDNARTHIWHVNGQSLQLTIEVVTYAESLWSLRRHSKFNSIRILGISAAYIGMNCMQTCDVIDPECMYHSMITYYHSMNYVLSFYDIIIILWLHYYHSMITLLSLYDYIIIILWLHYYHYMITLLSFYDYIIIIIWLHIINLWLHYYYCMNYYHSMIANYHSLNMRVSMLMITNYCAWRQSFLNCHDPPLRVCSKHRIL